MRWLIALLLIPSVLGLSVEEQMVAGEHPALYGDVLAFTQDGHVKVFEFSRGEAYDFGAGSNPSLFGFSLAFEDEGLVKYVNVQDKKVIQLGQGRDPFVFANEVVFSTKEKDLQVDFSNDGDLDDDIVRLYDIKTGELSNLKAVGRFPKVNSRRVVFLSEERQVGFDLNSDGDKKDTVIRILDKESRQVSNTKQEAQELALGKAGMLAFVSQEKIGFMDVLSEQTNMTGLKGVHPSIYEKEIIFERGGILFGYSTETGQFAQIQVAKGTDPSLFNNQVAFVSDESVLGDLNADGAKGKVVRIAVAEDADGDRVRDFVDNCQKESGVGEDRDGDGVGDACETMSAARKEQPAAGSEPPKVNSQPSSVNPEPSTADNQPQAANQDGIPWYYYVLIVLFAVVLGPPLWGFAIRYYKRKRKSFGF